MTINDLLKKLRKTGDCFNTYEVPLKMDGKDFDVELSIEGDWQNGYFVELKEKENGEEK